MWSYKIIVQWLRWIRAKRDCCYFGLWRHLCMTGACIGASIFVCLLPHPIVWTRPTRNLVNFRFRSQRDYTLNEKKRSERRKHCALAVVRFGHRPTVTHPQTGPTTIHCTAKLSAQCNETRHWTDQLRDRRTDAANRYTSDRLCGVCTRGAQKLSTQAPWNNGGRYSFIIRTRSIWTEYQLISQLLSEVSRPGSHDQFVMRIIVVITPAGLARSTDKLLIISLRLSVNKHVSR